MTHFALLFTLAAIGISETAYLIRKRKHSERPTCFIGGGCNVVLESKYNTIFGLHNDILGLFFYIFIGIMTALVVVEAPEPQLTFFDSINGNFWMFLGQVSIGIGVLMSLIFIYLQWKVIQAWCFWCLMSALTIWLMGIIIVVSSLV